METDRKLRTAVNYYRRNTLKKYFQVWKKYASHKYNLKKNTDIIQRNDCLDLKVFA